MTRTDHRLLAVILALASLAALPGRAEAAPGDVGTTFSGDGFALGELGNATKLRHAGAVALAPSSDGKLVAALDLVVHPRECEFSCFSEVKPGVARFSADGSLDPTFAGDGELLLDELPRTAEWVNVDLNDVAVQPDGKIILAGSGNNASAIWVARLNPNGTPDPSFGGDGAVLHDLLGGTASTSDELSAVALAPNGRIVVGGTSDPDLQNEVFTVARLLADGSLDPSFSQDGWLAEPHPNDAYQLIGVAIGADGRIVAVGNPIGDGPNVYAFAPDGTRDAGFSVDGAATLDVGVSAIDMALDPAGRVLLAGERGSEDVSVLIRLTAGGELDGSFGLGGAVTISPPEIVPLATLSSTQLAVDAQARPLVASTLGPTVVGRFSTTGEIDPTFSENGWSPAWAAKRLSGVSDLALTAAGAFIAGGSRSHVMVAKRGIDDGPTDSDGDGRPNEGDDCPYSFGARGCPRLALRIPRLRYGREHRRLGLHGRLRTREAPCKSDRDVAVLRKRPGPDRLIARVRSNRGGIHVYDRFSDGQFYARVKRHIVGYGFCAGARSAALKLR